MRNSNDFDPKFKFRHTKRELIAILCRLGLGVIHCNAASSAGLRVGRWLAPSPKRLPCKKWIRMRFSAHGTRFLVVKTRKSFNELGKNACEQIHAGDQAQLPVTSHRAFVQILKL